MKYLFGKRIEIRLQSHPSRGAWIEIPSVAPMSSKHCVAPLTGCVD